MSSSDACAYFSLEFGRLKSSHESGQWTSFENSRFTGQALREEIAVLGDFESHSYP